MYNKVQLLISLKCNTIWRNCINTFLWCINDQIFIAPSDVQKERIEADDLFVQNLNGEDIIAPKAEKKLSKSQCTPIFMCAYNGKLEDLNFFITNNILIQFRA